MADEKLVRDFVPKIIEQSGKNINVHVVEGNDFFEKLKDKLKEEVDEFVSDEAIEELADILEIVYLLSKYKGVSPEKLEEFRQFKSKERGSYEKGFVLEKKPL